MRSVESKLRSCGVTSGSRWEMRARTSALSRSTPESERLAFGVGTSRLWTRTSRLRSWSVSPWELERSLREWELSPPEWERSPLESRRSPWELERSPLGIGAFAVGNWSARRGSQSARPGSQGVCSSESKRSRSGFITFAVAIGTFSLVLNTLGLEHWKVRRGTQSALFGNWSDRPCEVERSPWEVERSPDFARQASGSRPC